MPFRRRVPAGLVVLLLALLPLGPAAPGAPAAPLTQSCSPRPAVGVTVVPAGAGRVQATIAASGSGNTLRQLRFETATNAQVEIDGVVRTVPFTTDLPAGTTQKVFLVRQVASGQAATIARLVVVDGCGEWPTLVGAGPDVFVPTVPPSATSVPPTATRTPTPTATPTVPPNVIARPDTAGRVGEYTSLALDAAGNPVVSYQEGELGDLKVLHCGNPTCTAPPGCGAGQNCITSPDTTGEVGLYTSLALDTAGNPVVAYLDRTNLTLKILRCGNSTCTGGNSIQTVFQTSSFSGEGISLKLDANGFPVVSFQERTQPVLAVLHCGNATCTGTIGCLPGQNCIAFPDPQLDTGAYSSLALDTAGNPVVAYRARSTQPGPTRFNLRVLHCGNPTCTSGNSITAPDTGDNVGFDTSLVLDAAGNPVVSYYDFSLNRLKVLHCGNPNCTTGSPIIPDNTNGGRHTSLRLDAAGNPVVSYRDGTTDDLKVLHCGNPNCTSGNTLTQPDPAADASWTSLRLDAAGNPVVSYWDAEGAVFDLKVLHCVNPACSGPSVVVSDAPAPSVAPAVRAAAAGAAPQPSAPANLLPPAPAAPPASGAASPPAPRPASAPALLPLRAPLGFAPAMPPSLPARPALAPAPLLPRGAVPLLPPIAGPYWLPRDLPPAPASPEPAPASGFDAPPVNPTEAVEPSAPFGSGPP